MASRTIVSCDWCGVESRISGAAEEGWAHVYDGVLSDDGLLCAECLKAARDAVTRAHQERKAAGSKT